jgi:hypothetical protein
MTGLPLCPRGRPNAAAKAQHQEELRQFCDLIQEIRSID